jgi:hypothetical protein
MQQRVALAQVVHQRRDVFPWPGHGYGIARQFTIARDPAAPPGFELRPMPCGAEVFVVQDFDAFRSASRASAAAICASSADGESGPDVSA